MNPTIRHNLDLVDRHIRDEARDVDSVLALYTDDVVLEIPSRGLRFDTHAAIRENYLRMFAAMAEVELEPIDRFATEDRVVDEMRVRFRLTGDGFTHAPVPVGSRVKLHLIHHFHIRDGLIAREKVFEIWQAEA